MEKETKLTPAIIIRVILFFVILALITAGLSEIFIPYDAESTRQAKSFYDIEDDSVDVLIVTSSTGRNGLSPNEMWHEYGISAYTRGDSRQAPLVALFNAEDAFKHQHPKLVILAVTQLFAGYKYRKNEPFLRKGMDYKKFSLDKLKIIEEIVFRDRKQNTLSYLFPLLRYHSRWTDITYEDVAEELNPEHDHMRGQHRVRKLQILEDRPYYDPDAEPAEYSPSSWDDYQRVIECARENGAEVLLISMPEFDFTYDKHLTIEKLAKEVGVNYLDLNMEENFDKAGFEFGRDFYDIHHLNLIGARKATLYLSQYILDNYDIPQWSQPDNIKDRLDADYELYKTEYNKYYKKHYLPRK